MREWRGGRREEEGEERREGVEGEEGRKEEEGEERREGQKREEFRKDSILHSEYVCLACFNTHCPTRA